MAARGAREHERTHAIGMHHADGLREHATHRRAHHVRELDALRVEHLDRVGRHAHEVVRAGRHLGVPGAAVVGSRRTGACRPKAPCWRPHAAAFIPRPWIISTGVPDFLPHVSYAMRTPSLRDSICAHVLEVVPVFEQLGHRVAHGLAEARPRARRITRRSYGSGERHERTEPDAPRRVSRCRTARRA